MQHATTGFRDVFRTAARPDADFEEVPRPESGDALHKARRRVVWAGAAVAAVGACLMAAGAAVGGGVPRCPDGDDVDGEPLSDCSTADEVGSGLFFSGLLPLLLGLGALITGLLTRSAVDLLAAKRRREAERLEHNLAAMRNREALEWNCAAEDPAAWEAYAGLYVAKRACCESRSASRFGYRLHGSFMVIFFAGFLTFLGVRAVQDPREWVTFAQMAFAGAALVAMYVPFVRVVTAAMRHKVPTSASRAAWPSFLPHDLREHPSWYSAAVCPRGGGAWYRVPLEQEPLRYVLARHDLGAGASDGDVLWVLQQFGPGLRLASSMSSESDPAPLGYLAAVVPVPGARVDELRAFLRGPAGFAESEAQEEEEPSSSSARTRLRDSERTARPVHEFKLGAAALAAWRRRADRDAGTLTMV